MCLGFISATHDARLPGQDLDSISRTESIFSQVINTWFRRELRSLNFYNHAEARLLKAKNPDIIHMTRMCIPLLISISAGESAPNRFPSNLASAYFTTAVGLSRDAKASPDSAARITTGIPAAVYSVTLWRQPCFFLYIGFSPSRRNKNPDAHPAAAISQ